ncbi:hypothetical protein Mucpa_5531 [Mucilaginibacter paludis DSM 18603]|uniref:Uncharacterized protein n=1 Tax=Mucilaginibacter paludis DSM 18603 TaxID=714943 RepID=H1YC39_9SPHI|nr:hypothetical protein Mucpa_5531 [Mucilaginibacter paludis DSM 18603]
MAGECANNKLLRVNNMSECGDVFDALDGMLLLPSNLNANALKKFI